MKFKNAALALALGALFIPVQSQAQSDSVKIAFITDMSGLYSDFDGPGGLDAVRMAVSDFGGKVLGKPVEVLFADHQNKADIAANRARQWWDQDNVDLVIGGSNSSASLAISNISKEKQKVFISAGAGADSLTEEACQPYMVRYTYSTSAHAIGTATAMVRDGGKKWYFVTADYAFGHSLEKASANVVKAQGGEVLGAVRHPLSTADFSSFLMQAQASGADVVGLANGGGDLINSIKTAKEFGIAKTMRLAGLMVFITDVHSLGLETTAGMYLTDGWYWDKDDASREFSKRFYEKHQKMPTTFQAGDYSATLTYLKAVKAAGTTEADAVMKELKSMKIDDMFAKGYVRADGTMVHDMYLMQVKTPAESKAPWDYYKTVATIPGDEAYVPTKTGVCPLMPKS
ncbi:ABC transporter substrate-binding protein [Pollutimonas sp. M17]|uniref:ABC transporter substrate-binding protein n=1 Tax=Pollutimonas sp. M17 TaxID=2962065 RepID=UPI0021F3F378|nr:ABC transporter substrate-binding protein [Pollutimonas sp. M17]UYO95605.1 ABC transporter substrate-binding protein [Pollutimonas sp. M17]HWK69424.1 ABC transporter substrate-binding protein [Burkholderiaceae bacterium]